MPVLRPDTRGEDERLLDDLITTLVLAKARVADAVLPLLGPWRQNCLGRITDDDFYERLMPLLLSKDTELRRSIRARRGNVSGTELVKHLVLLLVEEFCDWYLCYDLWRSGQKLYASVLICILVNSSFAQALSARLYTREGPGATLAALFGLKVFVETWRTITDAPPGRYC